MPQSDPPPAMVRCNRGFGWAFWMVMGIIGLVTMIAVVGTRDRTPAGEPFVFGSVAVLILVVRAVILPRLDILPAQGAIRTRRRTVPLSAISVIDVTRHQRAGVWASFRGEDGKCLARMSIAATLFAEPTSEQWSALRHAIHSAAVARGVTLALQPAAPAGWLSAGSAISIVDAQVAWCLAGHRSSSGRAPAASLTGASIAIC